MARGASEDRGLRGDVPAREDAIETLLVEAEHLGHLLLLRLRKLIDGEAIPASLGGQPLACGRVRQELAGVVVAADQYPLSGAEDRLFLTKSPIQRERVCEKSRIVPEQCVDLVLERCHSRCHRAGHRIQVYHAH